MSLDKPFLFIILFIINKSLKKEISNEKLLFVWEHCRHGARGSYKSFDYNNWVDIFSEKWKGTGELTPIGMRMHYLLGISTRKKYNNFLSNEYNPDEIFALSTNINRTLISAYSNLQGIYNRQKNINLNEKQFKRISVQNKNYSRRINIYKLNEKLIEKNIKYFPVHIYNEKDLKYQLYSINICPGISQYIKNLRNSKGMKRIYNDVYKSTNENFGNYILKFMNKSNGDINFLYDFEEIKTICDSFIADYFDGRKLEKIKNSGIDMEKFYNHCLNISLITSYFSYYGNPLEKTVEIGVSPTFREIFDYMEKRISLDKNGNPDKIISSSPRFVIVSTHDISLAGIDLFLESKFNIKFKRADYASSQIFELWKNIKNGKYFINYLINLEKVATFDYNDFKNNVSSFLYSEKEIKKICFPDSITKKSKYKNLKIFFYFTFILIFLLFFFILYLIYEKKTNKQLTIMKINKIIEMEQMSFVDKLKIY
jgi:hypothetical protein